MIRNSVTWTQVNLRTIESNARYFVDKLAKSSAANRKSAVVMSIVKADAYGHGAIACAKASLRGGVSKFAVARVDEAIDFRDQWNNEFSIHQLPSSLSSNAPRNNHDGGRDISSNSYFASNDCTRVPPLLLLGFALPAQIDAMIERDVTLSVWSVDQLRAIAEAARRCGRPASIHIKMNTGMNRVGVDSMHELRELLRMQQEHATLVRWTGFYTHFACADDLDQTSMRTQRDRFGEYLSALGVGTQIVDVETHCSNSAATLAIGDSFGTDMSRIGIALYGLQPTLEHKMTKNTPIAPALSWYSTITQVRRVANAGTGISYSHTYQTKTAGECLATVAVGYADGFRRTTGNRVFVFDRLCDVVGRVTMDQIIVRIPDEIAHHVRAGDHVELIGPNNPTANVAANWKTIDYDVVCAIGKRVKREFVV